MRPPRKNLIQLRKARGLKQKDVARAVGITTSFYGMLELNARNPSLELAIKISEFFGAKVEDIFFEEQDHVLLLGNCLRDMGLPFYVKTDETKTMEGCGKC